MKKKVEIEKEKFEIKEKHINNNKLFNEYKDSLKTLQICSTRCLFQ